MFQLPHCYVDAGEPHKPESLLKTPQILSLVSLQVENFNEKRFNMGWIHIEVDPHVFVIKFSQHRHFINKIAEYLVGFIHYVKTFKIPPQNFIVPFL